jgi:D-2-hydroxyacid dehydrogenase (NADP+)
MARPELRKIVFTYEPDVHLIDVVREEIPAARYVVAATGEDREREMVDAQVTIGPGYDEATLARAKQLVWHHVPWAGVEGIVTPLMRDRGVVLTNSRGISAPNMAEHAIAFILAFGRAFPTFFDEQQRRAWRGWDDRPSFFELTGQTVLLLGTGAIGKAIAARLRPFGCRIIGARRLGGHVEGFDDVVTFDALPSILPLVDHVVSSLPLTPGTSRIVDRTFITSMKPGSRFYNIGRGGTVDQDALIEALHRGHLAGAGLDVTDPEPLPEDSPLWDAPNTIITGHTSGASPMTHERNAGVLRDNLRRYRSGEELLNVIDLEQGY